MPYELFANNASTTVPLGKTAVAAGTEETWVVTEPHTKFPAVRDKRGDVLVARQMHFVDPAAPSEIILLRYTYNDGTKRWDVTRGAQGTTPVAHADGFLVRSVLTASVLTADRSMRRLNVMRDFGAKGDGSTNDGPAIQAALDSMPYNGGELEFPPGDYLTNQALRINRNTRLLGTYVPRYDFDINPSASCKIRAGGTFVGNGIIDQSVQKTTVALAKTAATPGTATVETWEVASSTGFPPAPFYAWDPAQPAEVVTVQAVAGTSWTVLRGGPELATAAHAAGFTIQTTGGLAQGVQISNLLLVGNQLTNAAGGVIHGIRMPDQADAVGEASWTLDKVGIWSASGSGIYGRAQVFNINNLYITRCMRYGVETAIGSLDRWNDVKVINSYINMNRMGGVFFGGGGTEPSAFVQFTNCRFERSGQSPGNPTNAGPDPLWNADAAGVRLHRAALFSFTSCTTDANTGPGFDVNAVAANALGHLHDITFTTCYANRDGGGAQTALPGSGVSAGFRSRGFSTTLADMPSEIHYVGCESGTGKSSDDGSGTLISPGHGAWIENSSNTDWLMGRPSGATAPFNFAGSQPGLSMLYNDAGVATIRNSLGIPAAVGVGMSAENFWRSDSTAAVANQGAALSTTLSELDSAQLGTRTVLASTEVGIQVQLAVVVRITTAVAASNLTVSIRDTSNTANILTSVVVSAATAATVVAKSTWAARPTWMTGDKTLAVYLQASTGAPAAVIKGVDLRWKGGGS